MKETWESKKNKRNRKFIKHEGKTNLPYNTSPKTIDSLPLTNP